MIEPTGYTALDLVGYTDKGTYAANVNYVKNDLVHFGGNIWRILIDDTIGITPAEGPNYTLFIGEPTNLVERIIAPLEDNPATVAYQTGRQIIYNDYLYEVIQDISVGDILIAYEDDPTNANIKLASPVETQVLALNASKVNKSDIANNVTTTAEGKVLDARQGKVLQDGKADNSVVAPKESGTTATRAYAAGAHFIKDGKFCTAITAIAQGETFTLNTNYTAGNIGEELSQIKPIVDGCTTLITPSVHAWPGNQLVFRNIPRNNLTIYKIEVMDVNSNLVCVYIVVRNDKVMVQNIGNVNATCTYDDSTSTLTVTLPHNNYWMGTAVKLRTNIYQ